MLPINEKIVETSKLPECQQYVSSDRKYVLDFVNSFNANKLKEYAKLNNDDFITKIFSCPENNNSMYTWLSKKTCGSIKPAYAQDLDLYKCKSSKKHPEKIGHWCNADEKIIDDSGMQNVYDTAKDIVNKLCELDEYVKSHTPLDYTLLAKEMDSRKMNNATIRKYLALNNPDKLPFSYGRNYLKRISDVLGIAYNNKDSVEIIGEIVKIRNDSGLDNYMFFPALNKIAKINEESELDEEQNNVINSENEEEKDKDNLESNSKNIIMYGPPGTGKTYNTVNYAVWIIEKDNKTLDEIQKEEHENVTKRYNAYKEEGLIKFVTFHQSYSYEEFIEGLRPILIDDENQEDIGEIQYKIEDGVFKKFCEERQNDNSVEFDKAWNCLVENAEKNGNKYSFIRNTGSSFSTELENDKFYIRWTKGRTIFSNNSVKKQWMNSSINRSSLDNNGNKWIYDERAAIIKELQAKYNLPEYIGGEKKNKVFIIDEINRGNISKIFGELITLIEETKRSNFRNHDNCEVTLPYSKKQFSIPDNIYILGTMNTADRSLALMDTALRRRFSFVEMMPEISEFKDMVIKGIDIERLICKINERIEFLYDREHTIGHAFFMKLKGEGLDEEQQMCDLSNIFKHKIIPLLQEYFYDDFQKIRLILGDDNTNKDENEIFIKIKSIDKGSVFFSNPDEIESRDSYEINEKAFANPQSYIKLYL